MPINIIEFKARLAQGSHAEQILLALNPDFKGEDLQTDTYFNTTKGRLKLREGNIENALIWYERPNSLGAKQSQVLLYKHAPDKSLKEILETINGVKVIVKKKRRIYFLSNVKFHFDEVEGLGRFLEVEAIDESGELGIEKIQQQCDHYTQVLGVKADDFIAVSYSDLLMNQQKLTDKLFPTMSTKRLLLRQIVPADIAEVFRGLSHPEVIKYYGVSYNSLEATQEQMDWYAAIITEDTGRCWAICSADNTTFYGVATLVFWKKEHRTAEVGYWIFPEYWGKGIVSEAMETITTYGFKEMNLHRISAESEDDNPGSIAVLMKLGFLYEGTRRHCEIKAGRFINLNVYAKLAAE